MSKETRMPDKLNEHSLHELALTIANNLVSKPDKSMKDHWDSYIIQFVDVYAIAKRTIWDEYPKRQQDADNRSISSLDRE